MSYNFHHLEDLEQDTTLLLFLMNTEIYGCYLVDYNFFVVKTQKFSPL